MASSCVLRATGNEFDVTEFLRSSMLEPVNVFTRGERKTESKVWDTSGITVDVSDGETFEEQVTDAIAFIKSHRDELGLLKDDMGVEHTGLDFGVFLRDSVVQSYTFPLELVHLASEGSLSLELSIYVND